jgi:hypothetical protein
MCPQTVMFGWQSLTAEGQFIPLFSLAVAQVILG